MSPNGRPFWAKIVSNALLSVAQKFTRMGTEDPWKTVHGVIDYQIQSQLRSFENNNLTPVRVKCVPITLVVHALLFAYQTNPTLECRVIANMECIAIFSCLRPSKYTGPTTDDQAFALDDVALFIRTRRLIMSILLNLNYLRLRRSKNNNRGIISAYACSTNVLCCPVSAVTWQLLLHRSTFSRLNVPFDGTIKLTSYYSSQLVNLPVKASMITHTMRVHADSLESSMSIAPKSLSACSLQVGGRWLSYKVAATQMLSICWSVGRMTQ